ncbi:MULTISPECIES: DUF3040 domain-containing protein [Streptomyces]|uniref:DUF3040 domain-containing protein n=1 Tax=Streptomyces gardneri TaxID=66892 RepID=A0A4Y3RN02_9ACTN|nr:MULTISPECIES: DUF3040 domain-containing protein [Streptomyces]GEB58123.1 hypothetical protein SGA01_37280 [Streptomyces gardneri]GHH17825.1 hypothetical protein GCM10017674_69180 [Streptomyces gardneri]
MSYSTDDQRILGEIERGLTRDDPALATLIDALNQQFPETPERPKAARSARRSPRVVAAVVLSVIALLALVLTAVLGATPTPPAEEDGPPASRPAAMAVHPAP